MLNIYRQVLIWLQPRDEDRRIDDAMLSLSRRGHFMSMSVYVEDGDTDSAPVFYPSPVAMSIQSPTVLPEKRLSSEEPEPL
jgi:hypothetical protein